MYITRDLQVTKLYISPRLMKILNMGDSINCKRSEQPESLRKAFTGVQGAGPPGGGCKRAAPPCLGKFCTWQAKYAKFQALLSPNYKNI